MSSRVQSTLVRARGNDHALTECTALVDSCSVVNFIKKDLVVLLNLETVKGELALSTMNGISEEINERVDLTIQSVNDDYECQIHAWVVPNLPVSSGYIFSREDLTDWAHLHDVPCNSLPRSHVEPSLLLGTECTAAFEVLDKRTKPGATAPVGLRSCLGWSVMGPTRCRVEPVPVAVSSLPVAESRAENTKFVYSCPTLASVPAVVVGGAGRVPAEPEVPVEGVYSAERVPAEPELPEVVCSAERVPAESEALLDQVPVAVEPVSAAVSNVSVTASSHHAESDVAAAERGVPAYRGPPLDCGQPPACGPPPVCGPPPARDPPPASRRSSDGASTCLFVFKKAVALLFIMVVMSYFAADIGSRGCFSNDDDKLGMWINGPSFLYRPMDEWVFENPTVDVPTTLVTVEFSPAPEREKPLVMIISEKYSDMYRNKKALPPMISVKPRLTSYYYAAIKFRIVPLMGLTTLDELRCGEGVSVVEVGEPPTIVVGPVGRVCTVMVAQCTHIIDNNNVNNVFRFTMV